MRASNADIYQAIPRPLSVMRKTFEGGSSTGAHHHPRGQMLYATSGLMLAHTDRGAWAVPTGHAMLIPPGLRHDIAMHGRVDMLTAYIRPAEMSELGALECRVIEVSRLLDAALEALGGEPNLYAERGRGGHLAAVILDELKRASTTLFVLPLPTDRRLRSVCQALFAEPGLPYDLDEWAERMAVSRRTLTRRFREETGLSFGEWRRRLRRIHSLKLQAEGMPLKRVAAAVGYGSPQALNAMIRATHTSSRLP